MFALTRARRGRQPGALKAPLGLEECYPGYRRVPAAATPPGATTRLQRAGIFWAAEGVAGPTDPFRTSGKFVATAAWTCAMARHSGIPNLDIFAPITRLGPCRQLLQGSAAAGGPGAPAVRLAPEADLPGQLSEHDHDVLHSPGGLDLTQASYARARFSRRVFPITCAQMGISYSFDLHPWFIRLLTAQIYPCDAIVCSTGASREAMRKRLGDIADLYSSAWGSAPPMLPRLELIPWGVDAERFAPRDRSAARLDLDLPRDCPVVLCVARMRSEDKMDLAPLLLAFQRSSRDVTSRPILVLAGSCLSDYGDQVLELASQLGLRGRIRTYFNLPPACLPSLYAAADVFLSPTDSPSESFGLTIVEAMACGRPVIASDWDGYKELVIHGETGFKVPTDWADCLGELDDLAPCLSWDQQHLHVGQSVSVDVSEMARYLTLLLGSKDLREEMGRRGRQRVESLYQWPTVVRQWEQMWEELCAIAASTSREERDRLDYLHPHYFQHFSHYASRVVGPETLVRMTARGKDLLAGKHPLFLHPWCQGFIHEGCLRTALSAANVASRLGGAMLTADLVGCVCKAHNCERDRALMHVMWLAKYDLVCLGGAEQPGDREGES